MELWEELNKRWIQVRRESGQLDLEEEYAHAKHCALSAEERAEIRRGLDAYNPKDHEYNGPYGDDWVSAGVSHAIDYKEINPDFYPAEWVKGYDI